jgi:hypothetical protein
MKNLKDEKPIFFLKKTKKQQKDEGRGEREGEINLKETKVTL